MTPCPNPDALTWFNAQPEKFVRDRYLECAGAPETQEIHLIEVPWVTYSNWRSAWSLEGWCVGAPAPGTHLPRPDRQSDRRNDDPYLLRMISAIKCGLLVAPPLIGRDLVDGMHRLWAHHYLQTPLLPVYFSVPIGEKPVVREGWWPG